MMRTVWTSYQCIRPDIEDPKNVCGWRPSSYDDFEAKQQCEAHWKLHEPKIPFEQQGVFHGDAPEPEPAFDLAALRCPNCGCDYVTAVELRAWKDEKTDLAAFDYGQLDPGIRDEVKKLQAAGFETTDSGDGVSKPSSWYRPDERGITEAMPFPHVVARTNHVSMTFEAERMRMLLGEPWKVTASYSTEDKSAILMAERPLPVGFIADRDLRNLAAFTPTDDMFGAIRRAITPTWRERILDWWRRPG